MCAERVREAWMKGVIKWHGNARGKTFLPFVRKHLLYYYYTTWYNCFKTLRGGCAILFKSLLWDLGDTLGGMG